jgi:hypothetical protein
MAVGRWRMENGSSNQPVAVVWVDRARLGVAPAARDTLQATLELTHRYERHNRASIDCRALA